MKKCTKCQEYKSVSQFYKNRSKHDGLRDTCIVCSKKRIKDYLLRNPDYAKNYKRAWNAKNPDKHYASTKKWRAKKNTKQTPLEEELSNILQNVADSGANDVYEKQHGDRPLKGEIKPIFATDKIMELITKRENALLTDEFGEKKVYTQTDLDYYLFEAKNALLERVEKEVLGQPNDAMPSPQTYYSDTPQDSVYVIGKNDGRNKLITEQREKLAALRKEKE